MHSPPIIFNRVLPDERGAHCGDVGKFLTNPPPNVLHYDLVRDKPQKRVHDCGLSGCPVLQSFQQGQ